MHGKGLFFDSGADLQAQYAGTPTRPAKPITGSRIRARAGCGFARGKMPFAARAAASCDVAHKGGAANDNGGMSRPQPLPPPAAVAPRLLAREFLSVFRYSRRAIELVWQTNRGLLIALAALVLAAGTLPAAVAWVGARIVDAVVTAAAAGGADVARVLELVVVEGVLIAALAGVTRAQSLCNALLRAQLGQRINVMILEKALTLELAHFEDSEFYDKLTRARREASVRPLSLVMRSLGLAQNLVTLGSYGALLLQFSPWAVSCCSPRACPRSSQRRASPTRRSSCSRGARRTSACSCISSPCSRAKSMRRR